MKKHTVTWSERLLTLAVLLFVFQNNSYADGCLKLVAGKYCLGGSFTEALETYKEYPNFMRGSVQADRGVTLNQVAFIDEDVLDMEKVMVVLDGFRGKIVSIKFGLVADGDNDNGYAKTLETIHEKYCSDGRVLRKDSAALICDGGNFLIVITTINGEHEGEVVQMPVFGYVDPKLIMRQVDRGY